MSLTNVGQAMNSPALHRDPTVYVNDVRRGPVGTEFRIHLKGTGWTETSNILHVVYDNAYIGGIEGSVKKILQCNKFDALIVLR